ncbi:GAS2-like protein 2 [Amblyraja radiata]|uniref:GAS2-like protein 2 n=1 Tax=Amblyraja radiata TaxID=386614 RepID=UPI001402C6F6|nr:GAS2-like protein 2 [Amblyraja radiata]
MANIQSATAKSIRPFKSSEEYLVAMKEDLAEWLNELYGLGTGLEQLVRDLETGSLLCQHANNVSRVAHHFCCQYPELLVKVKLPQAGVTYTAAAQPGTFLARDNVSNFIQWCRKEMQIKDVLMFETEDLVLRKNEKNFVLCLLEVARRASKFGMLAPVLIQMEEEIEDEIREEMDLPPEIIPPKPKPQRQLCDFKNLDEMVRHLVSRCTCPDQFPMVKVSEGKYKVGDSNTLIFVRILRNHVMVRVGGGWDTLEHYLDKHDPCRCTSLTHKQVSRFSSPHRSAMPTHEIKARLPPRTDQPNKPQTTLILSRSQSPMPPVEWKLATPSALSLRNHNAALRPPSPDVATTSAESSARRNPRDKSEPRQTYQARQRDRSSTPSYQMPTSVNSGKFNSNITSAARTGREKTRALPITSKPYSAAQEIKRAAEPVMDTKKVPSQPAVPQQTESRMSRTWTNTQCVDSKRDQSSSNVNKQSTRALSLTHKPASEAGSIISKGLVRGHLSAPSLQWKLSVAQGAEKRSGKDQAALQLPAPLGAGQEGCWQEPISTRKPSMDGSKKPIQQKSPIRSRTPDPYSLNNNNNNKGVNNGRSKMCLFTPPPINPTQEIELYRSFEDEIVSNMKALEMFSLVGDNLEGSEPSGCSSAASLASSPNQKEAKRSDNLCSSKYSISPFQVAASHVNDANRPTSCGNGTLPPSPKLTQNGSGFGEVLAELVSGTPSLSHVDIENWIANSSLEMVPSDSSTKLQQPGLNDMEAIKPFPNRTEDQSANEIGSTCDQKGSAFKGVMRRVVTMPQNEVTATELNSTPTNEGSDTNVSFDWPDPPCTLHKTWVQQGRQKRFLRKPERVPSIYKLKLRPKIRPRRDNRPEKRPSRIPTPLSYRQDDKTSKNTTKSGMQHKSHRANSRVVRSKTQVKQKPSSYLTQPEELVSREDSCPSQRAQSKQSRTSEKQSITQAMGQGSEDSESWV